MFRTSQRSDSSAARLCAPAGQEHGSGGSELTERGYSRDQWRRLISEPSPVASKDDFILNLVRGKKVLDIGCIDHDAAAALDGSWLHARIAAVAGSLVGLDYLESDAAIVRELGYDVRTGDACDFDLNETFGVVVAGDIIEHLSNPQGFLECVRRHLDADGMLVITTPNPFNIEQILWAVFRGQTNVNEEHVAWLDPMVTWQLLDRSGYRVNGFSWLITRFRFALPEDRWWSRKINRAAKLAMRRWPLIRRDFGVVAIPR